MTDLEIFKNAMRIAKNNGYKGRPFDNEDIEDVLFDCSINDIIFNHEFAKAFFGDHEYSNFRTYGLLEYDGISQLDKDKVVEFTIKLPEWQCHLQQMVLEENPLKYLEKFVEEK